MAFANPETRQAWNEKNRDKCREYQRRYQAKARAENPELVREKDRRSNAKLSFKRKAEMDGRRTALLEAQGGRCAICKSDHPKSKNGWHTDHCHQSGVVRGVLCHCCNVMLGLAKDNPTTLRAAIAYLGQFSPEASQTTNN